MNELLPRGPPTKLVFSCTKATINLPSSCSSRQSGHMGTFLEQAMKENHQEKPHAILIPCPYQGHIIPFAQLAIKLASNDFTITFINTESNHHLIMSSKAQYYSSEQDQDIFAQARRSGLDIRYATISDGFPLNFDRPQKQEQFLEGLLHVFPAHVDDLVGELFFVRKPTPPPTCLIADTFFAWPSMISHKYNLVNVSFWTQPALVFTLYYHWDLLKSNSHFAYPDKREDAIDYLPGVDAIEPKDLTSYLQDSKGSTVIHRLIDAAFEDVKKADFVIFNTVQELEHKVVSALQDRQPFYAIGPLSPNGFRKNEGTIISASLLSASDCTQWLDTKPYGSVLYFSFGSLAQCSKADMIEIAHGLLLSEVNFIWVLRSGILSPTETDFLPVGFEDKIKDKGLIVPWCNQIAVISHPAVGGFLTHCGWNSVLESLWHGVPMLCFPFFADQCTNRKLVVDDWGVGLINLCDKKPLTRCEVAEKINSLMSGKSANELRENTEGVKGTIENALGGGSSEKIFNQFIGDVKIKIQEKRKTAP